MELIYGSGVINLPKAVMEKINEASEADLKFLIAYSADSQKGGDEFVSALGYDKAQINSLIAFWQNAGIISQKHGRTAKKIENMTAKANNSNAEKPKKLRPSEEMPHYNGEQIAEFIRKNKDTRALIDSCQQTAGKIFNIAEINSVIGMRDYLGLEPDYIMLLFAYYCGIGKKSVPYIEKVAFSLYEMDITKYDELEIYIAGLEKVRDNESKLRTMFGWGERALTQSERTLIKKWLCDFGFDIDVIRRAYEITIDSKGQVMPKYMNGILQRWYDRGCKNIDDVNAAIEEYRSQKEASNFSTSTFDTDEFFEAALRRTYGDE